MKNMDIEKFQELLMIPSPSGNEENIIKKMEEYLRAYVNDVQIDSNGNLIAVKKGISEKKLMLVAHADEVGMMVTFIDDKGFVYFQEIGGVDTNLLPGQRVEIHNHRGVVVGVIGKKPIHLQDREAKNKDFSAEDLWIDIAASCDKEAVEMVEVGDYITFQTQPTRLNNSIWMSKALDDKVGLFTLLEVAKSLSSKQTAMEIDFVVSVQEELGARGVRTAAFEKQPDYGIAIDVTHATDYPTCTPQKRGKIKLGDGVVIAKGPNINQHIGRKLIDLAVRTGVKHQIEPIACPTGTDANFMQVSGHGVKTALLSNPCRYMHSPNEMVSLSDVKECVKLLTNLCEVGIDN